MRSKFLKLNSRDFIKGLIVTVICTFSNGEFMSYDHDPTQIRPAQDR